MTSASIDINALVWVGLVIQSMFGFTGILEILSVIEMDHEALLSRVLQFRGSNYSVRELYDRGIYSEFMMDYLGLMHYFL